MPSGIYIHKKWTEERRSKYREYLKESWVTGEHSKIRGKKRTEIFRSKVSDGLKRVYLSGSRKKNVWSKEQRGKVSQSMKKVWENPEYRLAKKRFDFCGINNPFYGKTFKHTENAKSKIRDSAIERKAVKNLQSIESRTKANQTKLKKLISGNAWHSEVGRFYSLKNQEILYYGSSYELHTYKILEQLSKIKSYSRCNFTIPYYFKDSIRKYVPDIVITYIDETQEVIEVKSEWALKEEKNIAKFKAAEEYCIKNNLSFSVWTEKQIFAEA